MCNLRAALAVAAVGIASGADLAQAENLVPNLDVPEQAGPATTGRTLYTLGLGIAVAPDYEGSKDYKAMPLWNVRVGVRKDPNVFVQVLGPTLRSNLLPDDHWRLA